MVLKGDVRYTASKYTDGAKLLGLEGKKLYGPDTELGRWFRSRNSIVRIGDLVFVHAGISPELMARRLTLQEINAAVRNVLGKTGKERDDREGDWLESNRKGPLWYRGYFPKHAAKYGPRPDEKALKKILRGLKARHIVIGHTKVKEVEALYDDRRVIDIDTTWTGDDKVRGLLARKGKLFLLDIRGKKREFKPAKRDDS